MLINILPKKKQILILNKDDENLMILVGEIHVERNVYLLEFNIKLNEFF